MLVGRRTREPVMPSVLRPGSRPRLVRAAAGVGLVLALVVAGRVLSGTALRPLARPATTTFTPAPGPYRVGDRWACPPTRPVLAASDGRSHPPGHPGPPAPDADPVACYPTVAAAAAAGYARAPLPPGTLEVDGVYLVPVPEQARRQCREAAGRLGFAVPCPRLRPTPSPGAPRPGVCRRPPPCGDPAFGFLFEAAGFVVPSGYVGAYPEVGRRLVVAAARRPEAGAVTCAGERPVARVRVRGRDGLLAVCPAGAGPHRDGLLLRWREGGAVMAVSMTGHPAEVRRLVLVLATHLDLVPPGR
jgi:hypothetical protein